MGSMKLMGRPRKFDEAEVLAGAIALFGKSGFNAVSVDVVVNKLGLNRSSFYNIYGSKHGLFRAAAEAVCAQARSGQVPEAARDFVVVALVEVAPVSKDLRELIQQAYELCFSDPDSLGQHVLSRSQRTEK
ncbi:TetR/AcrR family transcriptional regulator [Corynebacterium guaraldiae]|nr:TetR family transcriptional regulator [Corynebacterium aurimucosum]TRX34731.1 TetR/AcrR family transcriptional regulator [Corynebacterium guaraldiae]